MQVPIHAGPIQHQIEVLKDVIGQTREDKYAASGIEVIDFINDKNLGFSLGNAVKYIVRFKATTGEKNGNPQDLLKAAHYVLMELASLQKESIHPMQREQDVKIIVKPKINTGIKIDSEFVNDEVEETEDDGKIMLDGKKYDIDPIFSGNHLLDMVDNLNHIPKSQNVIVENLEDDEDLPEQVNVTYESEKEDDLGLDIKTSGNVGISIGESALKEITVGTDMTPHGMKFEVEPGYEDLELETENVID